MKGRKLYRKTIAFIPQSIMFLCYNKFCNWFGHGRRGRSRIPETTIAKQWPPDLPNLYYHEIMTKGQIYDLFDLVGIKADNYDSEC